MIELKADTKTYMERMLAEYEGHGDCRHEVGRRYKELTGIADSQKVCNAGGEGRCADKASECYSEGRCCALGLTRRSVVCRYEDCSVCQKPCAVVRGVLD